MGALHNVIYNILFPVSCLFTCFNRFIPIALCARDMTKAGWHVSASVAYCFPKSFYEAFTAHGIGGLFWAIYWVIGVIAVTEFVRAECNRACVPSHSMWAYVGCVHFCGFGGGFPLLLLYYKQWTTNDYYKALPNPPTDAEKRRVSTVIKARFKVLQMASRLATFVMVLVHFSYYVEYAEMTMIAAAKFLALGWLEAPMIVSFFLDLAIASIALFVWVLDERRGVVMAGKLLVQSAVMGTGYTIAAYCQRREELRYPEDVASESGAESKKNK